MMMEPAFEPLPIRRRTVVPISAEAYQIISITGEMKEVQANTAYEAFRQSGFSEARRIQRKASTKQSVLEKSSFIEEGLITYQAVPELQEAAQAFQRKSPVVSADDLDSLMRSLQMHSEPAALHALPETASPHAVSESSHPSSTAEITTTNPVGVEVHGDGFDEIIPATPPSGVSTTVKLPASAESLPYTADMASSSAPALPPEQELSEDEVNRLLKG